MSLPRPALLVITGLHREARIAAGDGVATLCSGGDPRALAGLLESLPPPSGGILSFGLGGGLAPALCSGDVVVASHVIATGKPLETDLDWRARIVSAIGRKQPLHHGLIAGRDAVQARAADKVALHLEKGALAVDMESHVAGDYARRHGLPFAVIRAVSDPAARGLPEIATQALRPDGEVDLPKVLASVLRRPGQIPALIAAGIDSERAFASLRRVRRLLGPLFGLGGADLR
jgi:hopanoid-associated phosphorylase